MINNKNKITSNVKLEYLNHLFKSLNNLNINYCVLRGYEDLPEIITNDIDFGVSISDITLFFDVLKTTMKNHNFLVQVELIRHSVIKMKLINNLAETIKIDVWWQFNYIGMEYINIDKMLNSRKFYKNTFFIASNEYEFSLSYLKELLHNSIIRDDKIEILNQKMIDNSHIPFNQYFNKKIIGDFFTSVKTRKLKLRMLSFRAKISILLKNIFNHGLFYVSKNVYLFLQIKYFNKNKYSFLINSLNKKNE